MAGEMWQLQKTPLGEAILDGNPRLVKRLISKGEDVFLRDRKGNTYVHFVCTMYRPYVINVILAAGVAINAQNKFGNTALHVTALHNECCHVPDLMQCGINPYIKNKDGKTAADLASHNPRWLSLHAAYEPTLRVAIQNHDFETINYLFGCWCAVHLPVDIQDNHDMRQYAAGLTYHDIVAMIDKIRFTLMAVFSIKECNHKRLEYALSRGQAICNVNFLQKVKGGHCHHMLQHAIRLRDYTMVKMLLDAGAGVNVSVHVQEYIRGPLYFEVIRNDGEIDMKLVNLIFNKDIDLTARDERGRSALVFCVDRRDKKVTMEIINMLLEKGINIAMRDNTGCTARDVALFARRHDIVSAIDQQIVDKIRSSDFESLRQLAMENYRDIFINYLGRDTWIFAAGNDTDDIADYLREILDYWKIMESLHRSIIRGDPDGVSKALASHPDRDMLLRSKDKGGRGPLLLAVLYNRYDIASYIYKMDKTLASTEMDNSNRGVWHYLHCLPDAEKNCFLELFGKSNNNRLDVCGWSPEEMRESCPQFLEEERKKDYGMETEVHCMNKYEELLSVIRCKMSKLKHFNKVLRTVHYPVADFWKLFHPDGHPLVIAYRDLLHSAVNHHKEEIAIRLVQCKVDCSVKQKYKVPEGYRWMTAEERADHLGLHKLAKHIATYGINSKKS